jgi:signal transduction histidine kinase
MTQLDPDVFRLVLDELAQRTTEQTGVVCTLDAPQDIDVGDATTARHLYRIVQEAVSNALRHARPRNIWLTIQDTTEGLCVSVRDDGSGVEELANGGPGMGIPTMCYRAGMVGGVLQIRPALGGGTLVACTLPRKTIHAQTR